MRHSCSLLLAAAAHFAAVAWSETPPNILSASNLETLCKHAATDAKEFLRVVEDEGKKFRGDHTVWVLGLRNFSARWSFSGEEPENTERLHQLSVKLGRSLASPGRIASEYFSVATARPGDEMWQRLSRMLDNPRESWIDEKTRIGNGVGWILYGYLLDVPGRPMPYAVLKMTDVKDRLLVWGGCFSLNPGEPGHRDEVLYPECRKIAARLDIPSWAQPNIGAFLASTYWFQEAAADEKLQNEEVFADILILEFIRTQTIRPESRWIDPFLVRRVVSVPSDAKKPEGGKPPGMDYTVLSELHRKPEWQRLESFITGSVELDPPRVRSALLKCVKLVPTKGSEQFLDAFVLSGFCSDARDYSARRDWARRAIELGLQGSRERPRILRVGEPRAFDDRDRFRDILEVAIAQPEIPFCRVVEANSAETGTATYRLQTFADESLPPRSLYCYAVDLTTGNLVWARNQARPGAEAPDPSYQEYCNKLQISMRGGAPDYGQFPCLLWHLQTRGTTPAPQVGPWSVDTTGLELAVSLIDPSRPFILNLSTGSVFGSGAYPDLIRTWKEMQKGAPKPVKAILFQLLDRGKNERPAFVVKYLDPASGKIDWSYYDEPPGTPLPIAAEDDLLDKMRRGVEGLLKAPVRNPDEPQASVVAGFHGNGLLDLGSRPYEMMVSQLAVRRNRPPVEWDYLLALGSAPPEAEFPALFSRDLAKPLQDLKIVSLLQAEWVPSPWLSERHAQLEPRQLLLWETSPANLSIERFSASPAPTAHGLRGSSRFPASTFLHELARTCAHGAKNSLEWEGFSQLQDNQPVLAKILRRAFQDYQLDPGLTQNIVIQEAFGRGQIVSTGTQENAAAPGQGFPGLLSDTLLTGGNPDSFLLGLREVHLHREEQPKGAPASGGRVAQLFPPDWLERYPDGSSILEMPEALGVILLRRNLEYCIRQAGFPLADTFALRSQYKAQPEGNAMDAAAIPADFLKKQGEEQQLQTVQVSLAARQFRAFLMQGPDLKVYLVHSATVFPSAETLFPRNQILGSFPDAFRYFLVQEAPAAEEGEGSLFSTVKAQLSQAGQEDIQAFQKLWGQGKFQEARDSAGQVMADLERWNQELPVFSDTVGALAEALAEEVVRLETEAILGQREKVTGEAQKDALEAARASTQALLGNLEAWSKLHPGLDARKNETCVKLADGVLAAHLKKVTSILDSASLSTDPHLQNTIEEQIQAARFLAREMVRDLKGWVGKNPPLDDRMKEQVKSLGSRQAEVHRSRANALFPQILKLKKKEKDLKRFLLISLRDDMENTLKDMEEWSAGFAGLEEAVSREKARSPTWDRKDWAKSKPVPPSTLQDAIDALSDELSKVK
ncbi:MAG: hypothetical protein HYU36_12760 [Planctomycetes bacterium]|nr:hypothetical protein [Planctomycetota bacterium]